MEVLARALRCGHNAQVLTIKLTKKSGAYLSVEITQVIEHVLDCFLSHVSGLSQTQSEEKGSAVWACPRSHVNDDDINVFAVLSNTQKHSCIGLAHNCLLSLLTVSSHSQEGTETCPILLSSLS